MDGCRCIKAYRKNTFCTFLVLVHFCPPYTSCPPPLGIPPGTKLSPTPIRTTTTRSPACPRLIWVTTSLDSMSAALREAPAASWGLPTPTATCRPRTTLNGRPPPTHLTCHGLQGTRWRGRSRPPDSPWYAPAPRLLCSLSRPLTPKLVIPRPRPNSSSPPPSCPLYFSSLAYKPWLYNGKLSCSALVVCAHIFWNRFDFHLEFIAITPRQFSILQASKVETCVYTAW